MPSRRHGPDERALPFGILPEDPVPAAAPDERVTAWKGFQLSSFQIRAIEAVRAGRNVLVAAPTGAGKTLVAEYAMEDAVARRKRCIYTSPVKALSNQKYRDFRDDPDVDVGLMTGDVTIHGGAQVLIMTTEILRNAIFESPGLLADVAYVIFDEIHYMDDRERGTVWEESLIFLPPAVSLICLSATVSNVEELGAWIDQIRHQPIEVIREERRPVPLSHWCWHPRHGAFPPARLEPIRRRRGPRPAPRRGGRGRGRRGRGDVDVSVDPSDLFDELQARSLLPALVFSFSRRDCERLARRNEHRKLLDADERERMGALQEELVDLFQLDRRALRGEIFAMADSGVGYHHAGMLPIHKEIVERMFTAGLLKLLFTTETFALGINMPARTVVFQALRKYDGLQFDWLRTRDFMQMAGRAGRQGIDEKGYVYCVLGDRELADAPLGRLFAGRPEPVVSRFRLSYSTILHLVQRAGRERLPEAWEKSFHLYQAREKNERARARQQRDQRRLVERHLTLLEELGYLRGDELTPRGRTARMLNGYELQTTELCYSGVLEHLPARALVVVFVGMIHEERRRHERVWVPARMFGDLRKRVSEVVGELCAAEARLGIEPEMKRPEWGLTPAVLRWFEGGSMDDLEEVSDATPGDVCRVFRMAIQLMRNVRRALDPEWDVRDRLDEAIQAMNRDEIDARRQLELG